MNDPQLPIGLVATDSPTLEQLERRYIEMILVKTRGNKTTAAGLLGITLKTLYNKIHEYGWELDRFRGEVGA